MSDIKGSVNVKVGGVAVNVDEVEEINSTVEQLILQAAATLKARGVTSAKLTLNFKANIED